MYIPVTSLRPVAGSKSKEQGRRDPSGDRPGIPAYLPRLAICLPDDGPMLKLCHTLICSHAGHACVCMCAICGSVMFSSSVSMIDYQSKCKETTDPWTLTRSRPNSRSQCLAEISTFVYQRQEVSMKSEHRVSRFMHRSTCIGTTVGQPQTCPMATARRETRDYLDRPRLDTIRGSSEARASEKESHDAFPPTATSDPPSRSVAVRLLWRDHRGWLGYNRSHYLVPAASAAVYIYIIFLINGNAVTYNVHGTTPTAHNTTRERVGWETSRASA